MISPETAFTQEPSRTDFLISKISTFGLKAFVSGFVSAFLLLQFSSDLSAQERNWKDATGKFSVQAELIDVVDGKVVLKKTNGVTIKVPISKLSNDDLVFLKKLEPPKTTPEPTTPKPTTPQPTTPKPTTPKPTTVEPTSPKTEQPKVESPAAPPKAAPANVPAEANTMPTAEAESANASAPKVISGEKQSLTLDETHREFTDIPPRPVRKSKIRPTESAGTKLPLANSINDVVADSSNAKMSPRAMSIEIPDVTVTEDDVNSLPPELLEYGKALFLKESNQQIRDALDSVDAVWITPSNPTLLKLVQSTTTSDEKFCRMKSLKLLGKYDLENSLAFILTGLDDSSREIRQTSLALIEKSQDERAMQPLIDRFAGVERAKISNLITKLYGSRAEKSLQKYLSHGLADVRMGTSKLLGTIGTETSIPVLEELASTDQNAIVALQARSAVRTIKKRINRNSGNQ